MALGDIELDGRPYITVNPKMINRSNANQVAAKVGASGDYDDLLNWSIWVMDNWQNGMGQKDPEGGGWLYGSVNGLYKEQLLPCAFPSVGNERLGPKAAANAAAITIVTVGDDVAATYEKIGARPFDGSFLPSTHGTISGVLVLLPGRRVRGCTATAAEIAILHGSNTTLDSNTALSMVSSGVVSLIDDNKYHWHFIGCGSWTPGGTYQPCVTVTTDSGVLPMLCKNINNADSRGQLMATGVWQNAPSLVFQFMVNVFDLNEGFKWPFAYADTFWFGGSNYTMTTTDLWALNVNNDYGAVNLANGPPQGKAIRLDGEMYVPNAYRVSYPTLSITNLGYNAQGFLLWNGLLYRCYQQNLYYSADGSTWEGPFDTGGDANNRIRSIAGLGQDIIIFLDDKILKFAPGDVMIALDDMPPRGISRPNGLCSVTWQGNVYFTAGEKIIRFDGAGFLPMGPDLGEGAREQGGYITALFGDDTWLYCCTDSGATLAHNGQGWHTIGAGDETILFPYVGQDWASGAVYSTTTASVMINTRRHYSISQPTYAVYTIPGSATSPYRVGNYTPDYFSYFETDWFSGGIREVWKDFESIYIDGDNLSSSNGYVEVYWMDEGSTDWEYLGVVNQSGGQELRWSNPTTRPNTRRIRLRFHLFCNAANRMRINAIRVKFQPMVTDRWRWQIPILIANTAQQFVDGDTQTTYTEAQQIAHLDGLTTRVPPFIFKDTDGSSYEVKVINASRGVDGFERLPGAATTRVDYVYNLVLEQVTSGTYTP